MNWLLKAISAVFAPKSTATYPPAPEEAPNADDREMDNTLDEIEDIEDNL